MGGGLMQLVAYGAQDVYLTGDPQITYFKVVYRRHTNFSMECIQQTLNGGVSGGSNVSATISRNGDLIGAMHLKFKTKGTNTAASQKFANLISDVSVEIGGQQIDKHYGSWLDIWHELSQPKEDKPQSTLIPLGANAGKDVYVPLQFWFNRNVGLALPLIALQYHEVKINITFAAAAEQYIGAETHGFENEAELWVDYIFLDTEERKRFAQMSHEYLIDQLQYSGQESAGTKWRLNFNHPVKEIVWKVGDTASAGVSDTAANGVPTPATWKLILNGHDRFAAREETYFTQLQKYYHHTNVPASYHLDTTAGEGASANTTAVYSFALRPEEHQPSGTCNFSRIDNAQIVKVGANATPTFYAVNYNVLRVVSGMGGLAYSN